jgi:hypothetical protein
MLTYPLPAIPLRFPKVAGHRANRQRLVRWIVTAVTALTALIAILFVSFLSLTLALN